MKITQVISDFLTSLILTLSLILYLMPDNVKWIYKLVMAFNFVFLVFVYLKSNNQTERKYGLIARHLILMFFSGFGM